MASGRMKFRGTIAYGPAVGGKFFFLFYFILCQFSRTLSKVNEQQNLIGRKNVSVIQFVTSVIIVAKICVWVPCNF